MFGIFRRKKDERLLLDLVKVAAKGEKQSQVNRALRFAGITRSDKESDVQYAGRSADFITQMIMKRANVYEQTASDDDLYTAAIFIFILSNYLSYVMDIDFELASSSGTMAFFTRNKMDVKSALQSTFTIAKTYNAMTASNDRYLLAVGNYFAEWIKTPRIELVDQLAELFNIGRRNLISS